MARSFRVRALTLIGSVLAVTAVWAGGARGQVFFGPPVPISAGIGGHMAIIGMYEGPTLATDGTGAWVVPWTYSFQIEGTHWGTEILSARSADNGTTWSQPQTLSAGCCQQIATDKAGTWVAVWVSLDPRGAINVARSTDAGATWSAPAVLGVTCQVPQIATDGSGHWIVAWPACPVGGDITIARSADNGLTWTPPAALDAGVAYGLDVRVASDRAGVWLAVWDDMDFTDHAECTPNPYYVPLCSYTSEYLNTIDVWSARSTDNGGTWSTPQRLSDDTNYYFDFEPRLATDAHGNWVVAWGALHFWLPEQPELTDSDILVVRSADNGSSWTAPQWLNTTAATDSVEQNDGAPSLATDGSGVWVASWESRDSSATNTSHVVVAQSTDAGASWTAPALLNPNQDNEEEEPEIASDGAGHWLVVWGVWDLYSSLSQLVVARGSTCGNGVVEFGKQCDDGNRIDGDGCSSTCQNEMLAGQQLSVRGAAGKTRLVSRDRSIAIGRGNRSADDPVLQGATVRLVSTAGDAFDATYNLPAGNWRYVGKAGKGRGYLYTDANQQAGPITSASIVAGRWMKVTLQTDQLGAALGANPDPVRAVLSIGARTYHLSFGGTVTFRRQQLYHARNAPPPSQVP